MRCLPKSTALNTVFREFPDRFEALRAAILDDYQKYDAQASEHLDVECILFIFWSVEIGMLNSHSWWLDEWWAAKRFDRTLGLCRPTINAQEVAVGRGMVDLYRHRYRDVLRTIRNIYLVWDSFGCFEAPITEKTARLFLRYTVKEPQYITPQLNKTIHSTLADLCRSYIFGVLLEQKKEASV